MPNAADAGESESEIENLVEAVDCHARSLVLLAGEVAASGVRHATENIGELMASVEAKNPGNPERSLLASVGLSLRRLSVETQRKIRPLGVFQGGASTLAIGLALRLEPKQCILLVRELGAVGLVEFIDIEYGFDGYVRFNPAFAAVLVSEMSGQERDTARAVRAQAMAEIAAFLYQEQHKHAAFARSLTLLELPNLLAALEYMFENVLPERVVAVATVLQSIIQPLGRSKALARVAEIRAKGSAQLKEWSPVKFAAESAAVMRLSEEGRHDEAVSVARSLLKGAQECSDNPKGRRVDAIAEAHLVLGRALEMSGAAEEALEHLVKGST
jgi:hypothetical protein